MYIFTYLFICTYYLFVYTWFDWYTYSFIDSFRIFCSATKATVFASAAYKTLDNSLHCWAPGGQYLIVGWGGAQPKRRWVWMWGQRPPAFALGVQQSQEPHHDFVLAARTRKYWSNWTNGIQTIKINKQINKCPHESADPTGVDGCESPSRGYPLLSPSYRILSARPPCFWITLRLLACIHLHISHIVCLSKIYSLGAPFQNIFW